MVTSLLCASEAMAQTVVPLSLACDSALTEGWDGGRPLPRWAAPRFPDQGGFLGDGPLTTRALSAPMPQCSDALLTHEVTFLLVYVMLWGARMTNENSTFNF